MSSKLKFHSTVVISVGGELMLDEQTVKVFTKREMAVMPTVMFAPGDDDVVAALSEEERAEVIRMLAHNVVHRALMALHVEGSTDGAPELVMNVPEGERS